MAATTPWRVFYSYSHKDAEMREKLGVYLAPLVQQNRIVEWYDRRIEPGANWETEINQQLESAHLILVVVTADFLASEYCFGVELHTAFDRLKRGEVKVVPVLLKECLWEDSVLRELQFVPRDGMPILSQPNVEHGFTVVSKEIKELVAAAPPVKRIAELEKPLQSEAALDRVRKQILAYARLYERTRQRMKASDERTRRMQQLFDRIKLLSTASYPLVDELSSSSLPGDRLAAVAILQVFASEHLLPFLVQIVKSEKPFVGYQAAAALHFAAGALEPHSYPQLLTAIREAKVALVEQGVGDRTDRATTLEAAEREVRTTMHSLTATAAEFD